MQFKTPRDLGHIIAERRRALRLSQAQLAERVGVSRVWVSQIERGKSRADLSLVLRTLSALGLALNANELPRAKDVDIDAIVRRSRRGQT